MNLAKGNSSHSVSHTGHCVLQTCVTALHVPVKVSINTFVTMCNICSFSKGSNYTTRKKAQYGRDKPNIAISLKILKLGWGHSSEEERLSNV